MILVYADAGERDLPPQPAIRATMSSPAARAPASERAWFQAVHTVT
jgi:hypothetical protein